jgi:hypothetical protein
MEFELFSRLAVGDKQKAASHHIQSCSILYEADLFSTQSHHRAYTVRVPCRYELVCFSNSAIREPDTWIL